MFEERKAASGANQDSFLSAGSQDTCAFTCAPPPLLRGVGGPELCRLLHRSVLLRTDAQRGRMDKQNNDYSSFLAVKTL